MQIQKRSELQRSGKLTPTPLLQIQRKNYKLLVACSVTKGAKSLQFLSKMFIPCVSSSIINEPQSPRVGLETNSGFQSLYFGRRLRSTSRSTSIASTLSAAQLCWSPLRTRTWKSSNSCWASTCMSATPCCMQFARKWWELWSCC